MRWSPRDPNPSRLVASFWWTNYYDGDLVTDTATELSTVKFMALIATVVGAFSWFAVFAWIGSYKPK